MRLLAFDTATAQGSVAVSIDSRLTSNRIWTRAQSHSEMLTAEIEIALKESGLDPGSLDALAVGQGPGSFTGIRVAINAARALGYALKMPVYVFDTTEILVAPVTRVDLPIVTIINAQKNSFFVSRFDAKTHERISSIEVMTAHDLESVITSPHLALGDAADLAAQALSPANKLNLVRDPSLSDFPLAESLVLLTIGLRSKAQPSDWNAVQPLYIRASGAEETLRRK